MEARNSVLFRGAVFSVCRNGEWFRGMGCIICEEPGESDFGCGAYDSVVFLRRANAGKMAGAAAVADHRRNSPGAGGITCRLRRNGGPGFVSRTAWGSVERQPRGIRSLLCLSHYDLAHVPGIWASVIAGRIFHVHHVESRRRVNALDGRGLVDSFWYFEGRISGTADRMRDPPVSLSAR